MLLRFRVANHRSIRDEQELSLVAVPRKGDPKPTGPIPQTVRVAGIYGANASGKSNVLHAVGFMAEAVLYSFARWPIDGGVPRQPFKLDPQFRDKPSLFEIDLMLNGKRYTFGFELDDECVRREWLYEYGPTGRTRTLFERAGSEFRFGRTLGGHTATIADLTRNNALFASVAAANGHPLLSELCRAIGALGRSLLRNGVGPGGDHLAATAIRMPEIADLAMGWLKMADLGIVGAVEIEGKGELAELVGRFLAERPGEFDPHVEASARQVVQKRINLLHAGAFGSAVEIDFADESDGTQIWLSVAAFVLLSVITGRVLLIDEVDSSLHPKLSATIIQMFRDPEINATGAQLIFTSHDVSLLGNLLADGLLGRDEVWFTEKGASGDTSLIPLSDFKSRKGENFERAYLQGRYGAVPYVDIDELRRMILRRDAS
ncbi:hypothetical protein [Alloactinosynnema sp. L-07]|uniref:AAA family ATPase n=1 Tax=Alloactinosynnema sp. L-07 TaxID=1653480 RepID=UPI00065EF4A8|nr:ATP-binding protein [Alloactinosynnema sp. L-07]CRK59915.1 hypothetical protein [Alloactinosynnema sp. L-07]